MKRDILWIQSILPHRFPFLMVDRVISLSSDEAVGIKNVTINEPYFQGHFPNEPIMPGILIVEALAQLGGTLIAFIKGEEGEQKGYFAGIDHVRFRKPVYPGDQVILKVVLVKHKGQIYKVRGTATVDDEVVVEGELLLAFREPLREKER